jgi:hypothetical protein
LLLFSPLCYWLAAKTGSQVLFDASDQIARRNSTKQDILQYSELHKSRQLDENFTDDFFVEF